MDEDEEQKKRERQKKKKREKNRASSKFLHRIRTFDSSDEYVKPFL